MPMRDDARNPYTKRFQQLGDLLVGLGRGDVVEQVADLDAHDASVNAGAAAASANVSASNSYERRRAA